MSEKTTLFVMVKEGQSISVGEADIEVMSYRGHGTGKAVRLKINAPKEVKIVPNVDKKRSEVKHE